MPIPSTCHSKTLVVKGLVKGYARLSTNVIFVITMSPLCTISLLRWYFLWTCFWLLWLLGSLDCATTPLLSQWTISGCRTKGTTPSFIRNFLSHTASLVALQVAIYPATEVESAIHSYLILLQLITPPPSRNTYPKVDFLESLSDMKSESIYPTRINSSLPYKLASNL